MGVNSVDSDWFYIDRPTYIFCVFFQSGEKLLVLKRKYRDGVYSGEPGSGTAAGQSVPPKKTKMESVGDAAEDAVGKDAVPAGAEAASSAGQESTEVDGTATGETQQGTEAGKDAADAVSDTAEMDEKSTESGASVASEDAVFVDAVEQQSGARKTSDEEKQDAKDTTGGTEVSQSADEYDSVFMEAASESGSMSSSDGVVKVGSVSSSGDVARAAVEAAMGADVSTGEGKVSTGEGKDTDSTDASSETDGLVTPTQSVSIRLHWFTLINLLHILHAPH